MATAKKQQEVTTQRTPEEVFDILREMFPNATTVQIRVSGNQKNISVSYGDVDYPAMPAPSIGFGSR